MQGIFFHIGLSSSKSLKYEKVKISGFRQPKEDRLDPPSII